MRYVLPLTAIISVLWSLLAFLVPSHIVGLTDFQMGELGGKGFLYIWVVGIIVWIIWRLKKSN
jgi:hypothetical protein